MIGVAGAICLLGSGRIMGVSGIVGGLVDGTGRRTAAERLVFIAALIVAPAAAASLTGGAATHLTTNLAQIAAAGLLVGLGTRIARGCTSGHGVCGISRLSLRGIVATLVYILAGGVTVAAMRALGVF